MSGYGTGVKLLECTPNAERLIEHASRLCVDKVEGIQERDNYIADRIAQGHLSVLEHASASWWLLCSRVTSQQLVRHRLAAVSQRSQRFVKETEPRYITPPELTGNMTSAVGNVTPAWEFSRAMDAAWQSYRRLLDAGVKPDQARYVLPNATETQLVATWNFRETLHIIKLRTSPKASLEMQELIGKVQDICVENWPQVFGHV